jgi:hypothetical protein
MILFNSEKQCIYMYRGRRATAEEEEEEGKTTVPTPLITRVNSGVLQGQQFPLH